MFRAGASHGSQDAPLRSASAVRLATSVSATTLSSRDSADQRRRVAEEQSKQGDHGHGNDKKGKH